MSAHMMKPLAIFLLAACLVMGLGACAKKTLIPPETGAGPGSTDSNYPPADHYSEGNLPPEGRLDDAFDRNGGSGAAGGNDAAMNQSDEYKRAHGRCSAGFSPIYFDYNKAAISASMRSRIETNADWLRSHPQSQVVIEGNTDVRGTSEYNMALGERRALAAKRELVKSGIDSGRIRTVSLGKERPLFEGLSEDAHAQNRRDDFIAE